MAGFAALPPEIVQRAITQQMLGLLLNTQLQLSCSVPAQQLGICQRQAVLTCLACFLYWGRGSTGIYMRYRAFQIGGYARLSLQNMQDVAATSGPSNRRSCG